MDINLGDIVSLKAHPYNEGLDNALITGDHQQIPPLMIVIEQLKDIRDNWDEHTGNQTSTKGHAQCKCIWYSNKSNQFEETWIHSGSLKMILKSPEPLQKRDLNVGSCLVSLRSMDLELGKRKSSFTMEGHNSFNEPGKTVISSFLAYLPPVMQVIEVKKNEPKEPIYDSKTGWQKRFVPAHLVKCRWFNSASDKVSEKLLPLEALMLIPALDQSLLDIITDTIEKNKYLVIADDSKLVEPKEITYRSGYYHVSGYNFISNSIVEVKLNSATKIESPKIEVIASYFIEKAPSYHNRTGDTSSGTTSFLQQKTEVIQDPNHKTNYLRIRYISLEGKESIRTISRHSIHKINEENKEVYYLTGYCHLRRAERMFRVERIRNLEVLNLKYE